MPRYYFDTRDDDDFVEDEDGWELPDVQAVKVKAGKALAELALEAIPGSVRRHLSVEVRDEQGPVLAATMTFQAVVYRP